MDLGDRVYDSEDKYPTWVALAAGGPLAERYVAALRPRFTGVSVNRATRLRRRWTDPQGLERQQRAIHAQLGAPPVATVPEELRDALEVLTSPWNVCLDGVSSSSLAAKRIAAGGRVDLLQHALRGPQPEGRVHAALALLSLVSPATPLSDADRIAIEKLRALDTTTRLCGFCLMSPAGAAHLIPAPAIR